MRVGRRPKNVIDVAVGGGVSVDASVWVAVAGGVSVTVRGGWLAAVDRRIVGLGVRVGGSEVGGMVSVGGGRCVEVGVKLPVAVDVGETVERTKGVWVDVGVAGVVS